jgi:predicted metal-dependent hydrolase
MPRPEPVEGQLGLPFTQRAADLVFVRHPKARRYILRVVADGSVRVTVPRWGSKREAARFAERESGWIERERQRLQSEPVDRLSESRAADPATLARARRELPARLVELAAQHGLTISRVSIRNQRWRWGSCSPEGHICLNWRLVDMPPAVRDYVLIHELMHLKRLDHSPRFWKLVAAACPDYQAARAFLRTYRRV